MSFYKTKKETENYVDHVYFYDKGEERGLIVYLRYPRGLDAVLVEAMVENEPNALHNLLQTGKPVVLEESNQFEFENALKKAMNHFSRQLFMSDLLIIEKSKIDKKIEVDYLRHDEPIIRVKY